MEREIRIKVGEAKEAKEFQKVSTILSLFFVVVILVAAWDGKSFNVGLVVFFLVVALIPIWLNATMASAHRRLDGIEAYVNTEGVGVSSAGADPWFLTWDEFGGFQRVNHKPWAFLPHPESVGIEILDREGRIAGFLPGVLSNASGKDFRRNELWRGLLRELDRHVPDGGLKPTTRPDFAKANPKRSLLLISLGLVLAVPSFWVLDKVLTVWRGGETGEAWVGWLAEGYRVSWVLIPLTVGGGLAYYYGLGMLVRKAIQAEEARRESQTSLSCKTIVDHRLDQILDGGLVTLQPGKTYRYAHANWMKHHLKQTTQALWFIAAILGLCGLALSAVMRSEPKASIWTLATTLLVLTVGSVALMAVARKYRRLLANLDDVLSYSSDTLVVHKPNGRVLELSSQNIKPVPMPSSGSFRFLTLRDGSKSYVLDPTHLSEVD